MDKDNIESSPKLTSNSGEKATDASTGDGCTNVMLKAVSDAENDKTIATTSAASDISNTKEANEEEALLRLHSSDDDMFEDALEEVERLKENDVNTGKSEKVEKYFSDIESSDDSRSYEVQPQSSTQLGERSVEAKETQVIEKDSESVIEKNVVEKGPDLELELVDSDEESFIESPLVKNPKVDSGHDCEDESAETEEITSSSYLEEDSVGQDSGSLRSDVKQKIVKEATNQEDADHAVESNQESISGVLEDVIGGDNEATVSSLPFDEDEYLRSALEAVLDSETSSRSPAVKEANTKQEIAQQSKLDESGCEEEATVDEMIEEIHDEDPPEELNNEGKVVIEVRKQDQESNKDEGPDTSIEKITKETIHKSQEEDQDKLQGDKPGEPGEQNKEADMCEEQGKEEKTGKEPNADEKPPETIKELVNESKVSQEVEEPIDSSENISKESCADIAEVDDIHKEKDVVHDEENMEVDEIEEKILEIEEQMEDETTETKPADIEQSEIKSNSPDTEDVSTDKLKETFSNKESPRDSINKASEVSNEAPTQSDEKALPVEPESISEPAAVEPVDDTAPIVSEKLDETPNVDTTGKSSAEKDTLEKLEMQRPPTPKEIEMLEIPDSTAAKVVQTDVNQQLQEDTKDDPSDEDESLLVIDTTYKEDNENPDVEMDSETEQTLTSAQNTDSGSEGSLEVFYDKKCVNYECMHKSKHFFKVTMFVLNFYKIPRKKNKMQFVCEECFDQAVLSYENMCKALKREQPLYLSPSFKAQELVEIIDSSDEEEEEGAMNKIEDENTVPKDCIAMLEAELESTIRKVMQDVNVQNQLSWTKQSLQHRLAILEEDSNFVGDQLRNLQRKADDMHNTLYQCPKIKIRQLTPLDLNSGRTYNPESETTIPPVGDIVRESIRVSETYYAVKNKVIASWVPCRVMEEMDCFPTANKNLKLYKIKFLKSKYPMLKTLSAKHMAFFNPPKIRLPIGTRVIAYFDASSLSRGKEKMLIPSAFYPGIIAEPLKHSNQFRYLVFYDDGYFQYVGHKDVRLVCQASENVWEDVHHQSRDFIHNYLTQYAVNRPMVQTQKGQSMLVDYNGKWVYARVVDVDCSLVQMLFEGHNRSEWIYRGSTRLGPVYKETNNLSQKTQLTMSRISRRTEPFIRYSNGDELTASQQGQDYRNQQSRPEEVRSVAKKSVSRPDGSSQQPIPIVRHLNNSTIFVDDDNKPKGKVVYYTARKNLPPRPYEPHICSPTCLFTITHNLQYYSPLAKPLLSGWERQVFRQKSKKFIVYRGPCGKRMRNMEELHRYLRVTENELNVDNFDFSPETNCLAEYVIESCIVQKKDISNGKEKMPIPCVNYYDNTMPPDCIYSSKRIPTDGVPLNLDPEFLVGCECLDDCSDKARCPCWQLTYAGAKYGMPNVPYEMVGYQYKRLYEHVPTGIYECNSRCKCKSNCVNRVVQQPLQSKLQVFKTSNRGWGLRCINDVPRGSFICVYAGHLLTEQKANEGGLDAGDEYFAELDYIEVAEQIKEGYESDVAELDEEEEFYDPEKDDDDDEFVVPNDPQNNKSFSTRLRTRRSVKTGTDAEHDSQERQVINFEPKKTMGQPDNSNEKPLFGKEEACYIMDAKVTGNLGRYFNHSCSPNLFVQNVFVDTHDLRFPWVAFFAFTHIRAGTELTWNYNYEVGVVPGKVLYCQCGAPNCRQRLL